GCPCHRWRRRPSVSGAVGVLLRPPFGENLHVSPPASRRIVLDAGGFSPLPDPLPHREPGPFSSSIDPKVGLERLGLSAPVCVRSPVRSTPSRTRNRRSRGNFESPGLSSELFADPQECPHRPPSVHISCTALSPSR